MRHAARQSGTVLIVTMMIVVVMTALVLVFARSMRVEALATSNHEAAARARAIAEGAAAAVMAVGDELPGDAIEIGGGAFWLVRPNFDQSSLNEQPYTWGLLEESAKVNINTASVEMLIRLPGMTDEMAAAIVDWRDDNSDTTAFGAESDYYLMLPEPYAAKNAPFDTVEELLLVRGFTPLALYGEDANRNGVLDANEDDADAGFPPDNADGELDHGLIQFVTVYSEEPEGDDDDRINVNGQQGGGGGGGGGDFTLLGLSDAVLEVSGDAVVRLVVPQQNTGGRGGGSGGAGGGGGDDTAEIRQALRQVLPEQERADALAASIVSKRPGSGYQNMIQVFYLNEMTLEEFALASPKLTTGGQNEGLIHINTAPRQVLLALPGLEEADVDDLIAYRQSAGVDSSSSTGSASTSGGAATGGEGDEPPAANPMDSIAWITEVLDQDKATAIGGLITSASYQRTADIVAVAPGGRGFERYRLVYEVEGSRILLWQRLTHLGWPLDPQILTDMRGGAAVSDLATTVDRGEY